MYLTNPDKINKTACDLLSNQMDCCIPTHLISLHPSNWKMVYGIALRLRLFAGSCNRDKVSSTMIFVTSSQIGVLKKQFTQKWNICHYLLLNAALFHPVQVDQRLSQCHWKRAAHTFTKHLLSCSTREKHEGKSKMTEFSFLDGLSFWIWPASMFL